MGDMIGQSYNEQILQSIIDGEPYVNENPYPSRIEQLLMELKEVIEEGGVDVDQTYDSTSENAQSGTAVAQAVSGKISATDYATQTTGGTVKAWTTTDGSDTILHLATQ